MSRSVDTIWAFLKRTIIVRNAVVNRSKLLSDIKLIQEAANFITNLQPLPQKFNVSIEGQTIGFEIFYDPLLMCWKCNLTDALQENILTDATLMAGQNICQGLALKYRTTNFEGEIIEHDLAIKGLFVTEPMDWKFDVFERGVESTKYAFTSNRVGNCYCAILYFIDKNVAELYSKLINGEQNEPQIGIDDLDYIVEVK